MPRPAFWDHRRTWSCNDGDDFEPKSMAVQVSITHVAPFIGEAQPQDLLFNSFDINLDPLFKNRSKDLNVEELIELSFLPYLICADHLLQQIISITKCNSLSWSNYRKCRNFGKLDYLNILNIWTLLPGSIIENVEILVNWTVWTFWTSEHFPLVQLSKYWDTWHFEQGCNMHSNKMHLHLIASQI